ncbi:MAG: arylsulfatase [Peptoniphilaceae bacterium]|nr:arylsulfatase [Peptoniphilaceae bacterium]
MKKNIVFVMADQFRYDALGVHNDDLISTPTFNEWARQGIDFSNCYSATPTCVPARATLFSGLSQDHTGIVGYDDDANWNFPHMLAEEFSKRGYYTKAVGKMHVNGPRKRMGFDHVELHDGYLHRRRNSKNEYNGAYDNVDDYYHWLRENLGINVDLIDGGVECNSYVGRPFPYEEKYHPTNWVVDRSIDFLRTRDPNDNFFLYMSFVRPHSPYDPPKDYFDIYYNELKDVSQEDLSNWAEDMGLYHKVKSVNALTGSLSDMDYRSMLAGYYGSISHIDHQLNRFMIKANEYNLFENTIFVFTSDHGDMLGDHYLFRKGFAYQPSIHIPLLIYDPSHELVGKTKSGSLISDLIELRDIMPSLIDLATGDKLEGIDGESIRTLIDDKDIKWRSYLHGEHMLDEFSNHFIIQLPYKYIWYSQSGREQLFNLEDDSGENKDLSKDEKYKHILANLRSILIDELKDREEGFVRDNNLVVGVDLKAILAINENYKEI